MPLRRRRKRKSVRALRKIQLLEYELMFLLTVAEEESDEDMGFGLFD